jgi:arsenate reductase
VTENTALQESLNRLRASRPRHLLFLCVANSARSQLAEGLARALAPGDVCISSAGSQRASVHPLAIRVMDEIGIDIRNQWSKGIEEIDLETVDAVVTLCAPEECPRLPTGALREDWFLPDPVMARSTPLLGFRALRDELQRRISALFGDKGV